MLVCLAGVVWGTIGTAVQLVHDRSGLSPSTISAYRAVAAVAVLVPMAVLLRRLDACRDLVRTQGRRAATVGALTATFQLLFFVAVVLSGVGVTTVVCLGFAPVLLLVVAAVRRRRPPSYAEALPVLVAVVGLLLVSLDGTSGAPGPHAGWGMVAALGSGAAYALSADAAGPLSQRHDVVPVTAVTMTVAALVLVPLGTIPVQLTGGRAGTSDVPSWLLIVYLGAVTMALAYAMLFAGLRTTTSGAAVVATLVEPVTALLLAAVVLREGLTPAGIVGSLLVVAAIASLGRRPADPAPQ